eukprot:CAMPEP_0117453118 /NCGR_PEP_ID=MMETSP0759-20121206/10035_1 /TAXON_ID=63605 /ORGANISM="Percolomonas cosmopolitus, Strain WS" /LENGTH=1265 /DNA_ID=CAMNT_0005246093 /DNA_START=354 /DNA_END=4151 /DNA_ORIENTATION=+
MDIVYTWVNGSDPYHQMLVEYFTEDFDDQSEVSLREDTFPKRRFRKREDLTYMAHEEFWREELRKEALDRVTLEAVRRKAAAAADSEDLSASEGDDSSVDDAEQQDNGVNRFRDNDELRFSLRSLEKYAPWVRNIYIVTSGQVPTWLDISNPRVHIVQHSDIFLNQSHLPVFSSPAIENNLHRIPGLSKRFIYLNDDVFFGNKVYPEDFFSKSTGQNVFLSWDVPDCAPGCSAQWIGDGYCDVACNNTMCDWDGGDCIGKPPRFSGFSSYSSSSSSGAGYTSNWFQNQQKNVVKQCNAKCPNGWVGDKFCDKPCNVPECGFDAGDCGVENMKAQLKHYDISRSTSEIVDVPYGTDAFFLNMSSIFPLAPKSTAVYQPPSENGKIGSGSHDNPDAVRTSTISQTYKILTMTLFQNVSNQTVGVSVSGTDAQGEEVELHFNIFVSPNVTRTGTEFSTETVREDDGDTQANTDTSLGFLLENDDTLNTETLHDNVQEDLVNSRPELSHLASASHSIEVEHDIMSSESNANALGHEDGMSQILSQQERKLEKQTRTSSPTDETIPHRHAKANQIRSPFSTDEEERNEEEPPKRSSIFSSVQSNAANSKPDHDEKKDAVQKLIHGSVLLATDEPSAVDNRDKKEHVTSETSTKTAESSNTENHGSLLHPTDSSDTRSPSTPFKLPTDDHEPTLQPTESPTSFPTPQKPFRASPPSSHQTFLDDEDDDDDDDRDNISDLNFRNLDLNQLREIFAGEDRQPTEAELRRALQQLQQNRINRRLLSAHSMRVTSHHEDSEDAQGIPNVLHSTRDDYLTKMEALEEQIKLHITQERLDEQRAPVLSDLHPALLHKASPSRRKLMDMFGDSLVHVDKLLNKKFGRVSRKVPAHMPHMIDKDIMQRVYDTWPQEFNITSSNRFRSSNDMQYTFSYFYFMMHEGKEYNALEFYRKELDTNNDGALQDYEIRYLAVVMERKKISLESVRALAERFGNDTDISENDPETESENASTETSTLIHDTQTSSTSSSNSTTTSPVPSASTNGTTESTTTGGGLSSSFYSSPAFSMYGGGTSWGSGKSEEEIFEEFYEAVREQLYRAISFSNMSLPNYSSFVESGLSDLVGEKLNFTMNSNPYQLKGSDEIGFHMIRDDELKVLKTLDGLRYKNPKFVCLNDDMNKTQPNPKVLEALHQFYTWYFPQPSQFELPPGKLNPPHMYIDELKQYYRSRKLQNWAVFFVSLFAFVGFVAYVCYRRNWLMLWNDRRSPLLATHRDHSKYG